MRRITLVDPNPPEDRRNDPLRISLLVFYKREGTWGDLECLRGSSWVSGIEEISGEVLSHALHGHIMPLVRALGRAPQVSASRVSEEEGLCSLRKDCLLWDKKFCRPGGKRKKGECGPPGCYEAPVGRSTPTSQKLLLRDLAVAWSEGTHVVIVDGEEFSL